MNSSSSVAAFVAVALTVAACASQQEETPVGRGSAAIAAPSCGVVLTSIDGVPAYSNGECQTRGDCNCLGTTAYGLGYQCVELAQRYFSQKFGFPNVWPNVGSAWQMCDAAAALPASVHFRGSGYIPVHGDLAVLGNGAGDGHVAVVSSAGGGSVDTVEQNSSASGHGTVAIGSERCFIHANANTDGSVAAAAPPAPSAPVTTGLPCQGVTYDSWYCGGHRSAGDATVLYECVGGQVMATHQCAQGCITSAGADPDQCGEGGGGEPCDCHGTELGGNPVDTTTCGTAVCGTDSQVWTCRSNTDGGFTQTGGACP